MFTHTLSKEEQAAENLREKAVWENHIAGIFYGFLTVFILLAAVGAAVGVWLARFVQV